MCALGVVLDRVAHVDGALGSRPHRCYSPGERIGVGLSELGRKIDGGLEPVVQPQALDLVAKHGIVRQQTEPITIDELIQDRHCFREEPDP